MVPRDDQATREIVICAWGVETDWYRNLQAGPAIMIRLGRDSYAPEHRLLSDDEAFTFGAGFRCEHLRRLRLLSIALGWGDLNDDALGQFVRKHPFLAFRPIAAITAA